MSRRHQLGHLKAFDRSRQPKLTARGPEPENAGTRGINGRLLRIDAAKVLAMWRTICMTSLAVLMLAACNEPGREPGDDPTRGDEGPTAGRPASDPSDTVDESGLSGGRTSDMGEQSSDTRGTLDGSSDEITSPAEDPQ